MQKINCPCNSGLKYHKCCEHFIQQKVFPQTALELMRSRYSAHVFKNVVYIIYTTIQQKRSNINLVQLKSWLDKSEWIKLEIIDFKGGKKKSIVEFKAFYASEGQIIVHHEKSYFKKVLNKWYYDLGVYPKK